MGAGAAAGEPGGDCARREAPAGHAVRTLWKCVVDGDAPAATAVLVKLQPGQVDMCGRTNGATALHLAVSWGQLPCAEALLRAGARRLPDKRGQLPQDLGSSEKPASLACAKFVCEYS